MAERVSKPLRAEYQYLHGLAELPGKSLNNCYRDFLQGLWRDHGPIRTFRFQAKVAECYGKNMETFWTVYDTFYFAPIQHPCDVSVQFPNELNVQACEESSRLVHVPAIGSLGRRYRGDSQLVPR